MSNIRKVGVIGAGTMGSGIASHVANAGVPVVLLDVASDGPAGRSEVAERALARQLSSSPPAFMDRDSANLIQTGNIEDHLEWLADADWIAEAVVERLDVKKALYAKLSAVCKPQARISSNTSTIPLQMLTQGMSPERAERFCITHFFNPVRYMRLLEIVSSPDTSAQVVEELGQFCDIRLGKGVVHCNDTPGFLGNRVGVYALQAGITAAHDLGLDVEEADAIMGRPMGIPKTGVFGLYDLIGLDLMLDVVTSLASTLPADDPFQSVAAGIALIEKLVAEGYSGNKGLGGFYRDSAVDGEPVREAIDLVTGQYRSARRPSLEATDIAERNGLRALLERDDKYGRFAWRVLSNTLVYAARLVPVTSPTVLPIDEAMKLGYGWLAGPFEMIDDIGAQWFVDRLESDGVQVPEILDVARTRRFYSVASDRVQQLGLDGHYADLQRPAGSARLADISKTTSPVLHNDAASLWDIGDGVGCIEFHSKANALSPVSMELVQRAVDLAPGRFAALLIHNDAPHFSVGFNLDFALDAARRKAWTELDEALRAFQTACLSLKYAPVPVVAAPTGMSLGGGYEVLIHCDALQVHGNSVMGLVESMVGLVPSGGGCKELLHRWTGDASTPEDKLPGALRTFELIGMAKTGTSPNESRRSRFVSDRDRITMNRDRLLLEGKSRALELAGDYVVPGAPEFTALGQAGYDAMNEVLEKLAAKNITTPHDHVVGRALARVLCGGDAGAGDKLTEWDICDLERASFIALAHTEATVNRIEQMLRTGRALRN